MFTYECQWRVVPLVVRHQHHHHQHHRQLEIPTRLSLKLGAVLRRLDWSECQLIQLWCLIQNCPMNSSCPNPTQTATEFHNNCTQSASWHTLTCTIRRTYSNFGDWCFMLASPKLWNRLPAGHGQIDIGYEQFKRLLKTYYLFGRWDGGALWLFV